MISSKKSIALIASACTIVIALSGFGIAFALADNDDSAQSATRNTTTQTDHGDLSSTAQNTESTAIDEFFADDSKTSVDSSMKDADDMVKDSMQETSPGKAIGGEDASNTDSLFPFITSPKTVLVTIPSTTTTTTTTPTGKSQSIAAQNTTASSQSNTSSSKPQSAPSTATNQSTSSSANIAAQDPCASGHAWTEKKVIDSPRKTENVTVCGTNVNGVLSRNYVLHDDDNLMYGVFASQADASILNDQWYGGKYSIYCVGPYNQRTFQRLIAEEISHMEKTCSRCGARR